MENTMTEKARSYHFESLLIHGGLEAGPAGATTVPIVQSSSFAHATAEDLEDVFRGRKVGQVYTRVGNPTHRKPGEATGCSGRGAVGDRHFFRHGSH